MSKSKYCTLYLVRHGQTEWNVRGLLQGHGDSPLTGEGIKQAKTLAGRLKRINFAACYSSDLLRAYRTAEILLLEKKLAIKTTQALRERRFGKKYEGKHHDLINQDIKIYFEKYKHISDSQRTKLKLVPDMESIEESLSRVLVFLREMAVAYIGQNVLIVTHGGIMRHLLIHLGFGDHNSLTYGAISNNALIVLQSDGVDFFVKKTSGINVTKTVR